MKSEDLEKHFREQINDHQSFDLDPDLVWDSLSPLLEKKKKRRGIIYLTFGLIGSLLLISTYLFFDNSENKKQELTELNSILKKENISTFHKIEKIPTEPSETTRKNLSLNPKEIKSQKNSFSGKNKDQSFLPLSQDKTITKTSNINSAALSSKNKTYNLSLTPKIETKQNFASEVAPIVSLFSPIMVKSLTSKNTPSLPDFSIEKEDIEENKTKRKSQTLFNLEAGLSFSNANIQANGSPDYASLRKQSEEAKLGWGVEFNIYRVKKSGLVLGTGLGYQKSWVKFNFNWEDQEEVLVEDIPLHILIDLQTMDTVGIQTGNVQLNQTNQRDVQHYNEFQTVTLPLHVGYLKNKSKFSYGILGGVSYHYRIKQQGRIFDEDNSLINFKDDSYFTKSNFSAHLKPIFALKINSNYQLTFSPAIAFSLSDQIKRNLAISQRPITYSLSIGVTKKITN
ncbi:MAG: hypothetical protein AB8F94_10310 [Saprospiraceae bacterium]